MAASSTLGSPESLGRLVTRPALAKAMGFHIYTAGEGSYTESSLYTINATD